MKKTILIVLALMLLASITAFAVEAPNGFGKGVCDGECDLASAFERHEARLEMLVERGLLTQEAAELKLAEIKESLEQGICVGPQQMMMQRQSNQKLLNNLSQRIQARMGGKN